MKLQRALSYENAVQLTDVSRELIKCNVVDTVDMSSHRENQSMRHTGLSVLPVNKCEITAVVYMHNL